MATEQTFAVDRLHETDAVLVSDAGRACTVPLDQLPDGLEVRMVVRASVDDTGTPDWSTAAIDRDQTEKRRRASSELSEKLRDSDDHGFLHVDE
ncbi:MAG: DUF3006 family protein [Gemmatimonadales bacterium]|jgi:hypothetical protein